MAIAQDDVERLRSTVSIVDVVGEVRAAAPGRAQLGRAVPVPRREEPVVQRPRGDRPVQVLRLRPGAATCSRSSQQTRPRRLRRRRRVPRGQGRHAAHLHRRRAVGGAVAAQAARRGDDRRRSSGTTVGCSRIRPPARPATTCAVAGSPATWPASSGSAGRPTTGTRSSRGAGVDGELLRTIGLAFTQPARPDAGRLPGAGAVPDLLRHRRGGGDRRPRPAGFERPGEVQELAGDADLRQVARRCTG